MIHPRSNSIAVFVLALFMFVSATMVMLNVGTYFRSICLWVHSGGPVLGPATDPVTMQMRDMAFTRGTLTFMLQENGAEGRLPEGHTIETGVPLPGITWWFAEAVAPRPTEQMWGVVGYTYEFNLNGGGMPGVYQIYSRRVAFWISLWPFTALSVMLSVWMFRRYRKELRRRRAEGGLCIFCGYDLRATPDRCPECGAISEKAQA